MNFIKKYWHIIAIIFFGIVPMSWMKEGFLLLNPEDIGMADYGTQLYPYSFTWNYVFNNGSENLGIQSVFPTYLYGYILKYLGVSIFNIQKLLFMIYWIFPGLSIAYLVYVISQNAKNRIAMFGAAILYTFNLYTIFDLFGRYIRPILIIYPIVLALWIKGLSNPSKSTKYAILSNILFVFLSVAMINPPAVSSIFLSLFAYLLFHVLVNKNSFFNALKFLLKFSVIYLCLNFWWLSISVLKWLYLTNTVQTATGGWNAVAATKLLDAWRFLGGWWFNPFYVPFSNNYHQFPLVISTYLITIVTLSVFVLMVKKPNDSEMNRNIVFFGMLALIGFFLVKGTSPPFGKIYNFLYNYIPGFWIYREPHAKFSFITVLSISVMFGFACQFLFNFVKKKYETKKPFYYCIPIVLFVSVCFNVYPFFTRRSIPNLANGHLTSIYWKIPEYWFSLKKYLKENESENRVFIAPKAFYTTFYLWPPYDKHPKINQSHYGIAGSFAMVMLENPLFLYSRWPIYNSQLVTNFTYSALNQKEISLFTSLAKITNLKYVLLQHDVRWKTMAENNYPPEEMREVLLSDDSFELSKSFGKLELFKISDENYLPQIYVH